MSTGTVGGWSGAGPSPRRPRRLRRVTAQHPAAVFDIHAVEHERMHVTFRVNAAPNRWMMATAPPRPPCTPLCPARRRSEPSTARRNTPVSARHSAWFPRPCVQSFKDSRGRQSRGLPTGPSANFLQRRLVAVVQS
jgi:hypothetical protein